MGAALAFTIEEIEADPSLVAGATKECFDCDPDNPRAMAPDKCTTCGGTGRQALAATQIAEELTAARNADDGDGSAGGGRNYGSDDENDSDGSEDPDLYLEY